MSTPLPAPAPIPENARYVEGFDTVSQLHWEEEIAAELSQDHWPPEGIEELWELSSDIVAPIAHAWRIDNWPEDRRHELELSVTQEIFELLDAAFTPPQGSLRASVCVGEYQRLTETQAADLGRDILRRVLYRLRPDLFVLESRS